MKGRRRAALRAVAVLAVLLGAAGPTPGVGPAAAAPVAVAATPTVFGTTINRRWDETYRAAYDRLREKFGTPGVTRAYATAPQARWRQCLVCAAVGSSGTGVVYSIEVHPAEVLTGQHDATIQSFVRSKPREAALWVVLWHEPEAEIEAGVFTLEEYRAATARLAPLVREAGGVPAQIITHFTASGQGVLSWQDLIVPDVDAVLFDVFNIEYEQGTYKDVHLLLDPLAAISAETGKPFGIAEFGSGRVASDPTGQARGAWLAEFGSLAEEYGALFVNYWNRQSLPDGRLDQDLRLSDPWSTGAWRDLVGR